MNTRERTQAIILDYLELDTLDFNDEVRNYIDSLSIFELTADLSNEFDISLTEVSHIRTFEDIINYVESQVN